MLQPATTCYNHEIKSYDKHLLISYACITLSLFTCAVVAVVFYDKNDNMNKYTTSS